MPISRPDHRYPRVTKTLRPHEHGTLKLVRRYGEALIAVRYREDGRGRRRCTTVELVIDEGPAQRRRGDRSIVFVPIALRESELRLRATALGARWAPEHGAWRMTLRAARALGIDDRAADSGPELSTDTQRS